MPFPDPTGHSSGCRYNGQISDGEMGKTEDVMESGKEGEVGQSCAVERGGSGDVMAVKNRPM